MRILVPSEGSNVPHELTKRPISGFWPALERIGIFGSELQSLKKLSLHLCANVEFLCLSECRQLMEVDVQGMNSLKCLDIMECSELGRFFEGVENLHELDWFRWRCISHPAPFLRDLSSLTALQVLVLEGSGSELCYPPNLNGCINSRELTLSWHDYLESFPDLTNLIRLETIDFTFCEKAAGFPDLSNLSKLRKINFSYCTHATTVVALSSLTNLKDLNLLECGLLEESPGLGDLVALETLTTILCGKLSVLEDLRKLENLPDLLVRRCVNLTSIVGLGYLTSLRRLDAGRCTNLKELSHFSNLKELETVDLSYTRVTILPTDIWKSSETSNLEERRMPQLD